MRFGILLLFVSTFLPAQDTLTLEQLDYKFVSVQDGVTTPLTSLSNTNVAGVFIACQQTSLLALCGPEELQVWIDGRLALIKEKDADCLYPKIDALCAVSSRDTIFLSISAERSLEGASVRSISIVPQDPNQIDVLTRSLNDKAWIIGFVICGFAFAGVFLFTPIKFGEIVRAKTEQFSERPLSGNFLIQLGCVVAVGAFCWVYNHQGGYEEFFTALGFLMTVFIAKIGLYYFGGILFQFRKISSWQMVFQMRFWALVTLLVFLVLVVDNLSFMWLTKRSDVLGKIIAGAMVVFVSLEVFKLSSIGDKRSLHRFVYLCSTEILPMVLLMRIFLK